MSAFIICGLVCISAYILFFWLNLLTDFFWKETKSNELKTWPSLTILISSNNDAPHLNALFEFLCKQEYPKTSWSLFFTNDGSTDASDQIIQSWKNRFPCQVRWFEQNLPRGKKINLQHMAEQVQSEWILTTDADCYATSSTFLKSRVAFALSQNAELSVGALQYANGPIKLINCLQITEHRVLDLLTRNGIRWNTPYLCSGTNMLYKTNLFNAINGFKSHLHIASGDDVFMLNAAYKHKATICYDTMPESVISTAVPDTWSEFWNQKIRWASKSKYNSNPWNIIVGGLVMLTSFFVILFTLMSLVYNGFLYFYVILIIKVLTEWTMFLPGLKNKNATQVNPWMAFGILWVYPVYAAVIFILALGALKTLKKQSW